MPKAPPAMSVPSIPDLARRVESADPKDISAQTQILFDLRKLRDAVNSGNDQDLTPFLDAAVTLVQYVPELQHALVEEVRSIVLRLMEIAGGTMGSPKVFPAKHTPKAPLPENSPEEASAEEKGKDLLVLKDTLLGEVLVQLGKVNHSQVCEALRLQSTTGVRFGEALMALGAANPEDIDEAVGFQKSVASGAIRDKANELAAEMRMSQAKETSIDQMSDLLLGEILVRLGYVNREELLKGLHMQKASGLRIGEALVETGAVTWDQVREGVRIQNLHRGAATAAPDWKGPIRL